VKTNIGALSCSNMKRCIKLYSTPDNNVRCTPARLDFRKQLLQHHLLAVNTIKFAAPPACSKHNNFLVCHLQNLTVQQRSTCSEFFLNNNFFGSSSRPTSLRAISPSSRPVAVVLLTHLSWSEHQLASFLSEPS